MRSTILAVSMLLVATGCSSSVVSTTPLATFTGTYEGTSSDSKAGSGDFIMRIVQAGSVVSGRWGDAYAKTHLVSVGTFSGSVNGNMLQATATSDIAGECPLALKAKLENASLNGSYQGVGAGCVSETGSFAMPTIQSPVTVDSRPYHGSVSDDRFGDGAARMDLGNIVPPFFSGTFSFAYKHRQAGHVSGWITEQNLLHAMFMVKKQPGELAECEMAVVGARYVPNTSIDGAYESVEILPCLFKDRYGKFNVQR